MEIDLIKGLEIRISGEIAKNNTLPVDFLIEISKSLQGLVLSLARYDNEDAVTIDLNNFKLEFSAFKLGHSVIPGFRFASDNPTNLFADTRSQKINISKKLDKLLFVSNENNFIELQNIYPNPIIRNQIVGKYSNFIDCFKDKQAEIVTFNGSENYKPIYKINRISSDIKKKLLTEIIEVEEINEYDGVGIIHVSSVKGKERRKVKDIYRDMSIAYSTKFINYMEKVYKFNYPLYSYFGKEEDYYIIINEQLDITATGKDEMEAKINFAEEFDHIYQRYNELPDEMLSPRLLTIKNTINNLVLRIDK